MFNPKSLSLLIHIFILLVKNVAETVPSVPFVAHIGSESILVLILNSIDDWLIEQRSTIVTNDLESQKCLVTRY